MAHYAFIDINSKIVVEVIPGRDENEVVEGISDWEEYYSTKRDGLEAVRTSYNTHGGVHYIDGEPSSDQSKAFRFNYAGIGYTFDETKGTDGAFIPPQPFSSWILNEETCLWDAPIPYPEDGGIYEWNEENTSWDLVVTES